MKKDNKNDNSRRDFIRKLAGLAAIGILSPQTLFLGSCDNSSKRGNSGYGSSNDYDNNSDINEIEPQSSVYKGNDSEESPYDTMDEDISNDVTSSKRSIGGDDEYGGNGHCGSSMNCAGGGGKCGSSLDCAGGGGKCGSSLDCAGGGRSSSGRGQCGSSLDCAGGGGQCGSSLNCAGGGRSSSGRGQCGSSLDCAGGGGQCGSSLDCAGGGGRCGSSLDCAGS